MQFKNVFHFHLCFCTYRFTGSLEIVSKTVAAVICHADASCSAKTA